MILYLQVHHLTTHHAKTGSTIKAVGMLVTENIGHSSVEAFLCCPVSECQKDGKSIFIVSLK